MNKNYSKIYAATGIVITIILILQILSYRINYKEGVQLTVSNLEMSSYQSSNMISEENQEASDVNGRYDQISLNEATKDQLMTIDGIGESKADAIIKARAELGEFTSLTQLMEIKGIGEALYQKIIERVYIE